MISRLDDALSQPTFDALTVELTTPSSPDARAALDEATRVIFGETQENWQIRPIHITPVYPFNGQKKAGKVS